MLYFAALVFGPGYLVMQDASDRRTLQAAYRRLGPAEASDDEPVLRRLYAPSYVAVGADGRSYPIGRDLFSGKRSRTLERHETRLIGRRQKYVLLSLKLAKDRAFARVRVEQSWSRVVDPGKGPVPFFGSGVALHDWRKGPEGWRLVVSRSPSPMIMRPGRRMSGR